MLSHVTVGVSNLARARAFYERIFAPLRILVRFSDSKMVVFQHERGGRPMFIAALPYDGAPAAPGNGGMTALTASSRPVVDEVHAIALTAGGVDEGRPGLRAHYHPAYYGAYFRDPDGNKLCVVCHLPDEPSSG